MERYLYNGAKFTNRGMAFGKKVATALEEDELTGDMQLDILLVDLPKFELRDAPLHAEIKIGKEVIPLFGKIDSLKQDMTAFKEYKTGVEKWTQRKVDEDKQITFYATMIYLLTKKIPHDIELIWIPTVQDPETQEIRATGEIVRFPTKRTMSHILNEIVDIRKVWKEIEIMCEEELL